MTRSLPELMECPGVDQIEGPVLVFIAMCVLALIFAVATREWD